MSVKTRSHPKLTGKDYYNRHSEFTTWLLKRYHTHFDEISNSRAHHYFSKFIKHWNNNELSEDYYKGIPPTSLNPLIRSSYRWPFTSYLSDDDILSLATIRDTIDTNNKKKEKFIEIRNFFLTEVMNEDEIEEKNEEDTYKREEIRAALQIERKIWNKSNKELIGSFQRKLEKKRERGSYCHYDKLKEADFTVSDDMIYGSDGADIDILAKKRMKEKRREIELHNKLIEHRRKENEKMKNFAAQMNIPLSSTNISE